jgi:GeoRSP system PqqD family protein
MERIYRNPDVMWREEDDALLDARQALERGEDAGEIGTAVLFSGGAMLSINYLGMEIWKLCDGRSVDGIVSELLSRYEVEEEVLREDVAAFLDELSAKGFIRHEE